MARPRGTRDRGRGRPGRAGRVRRRLSGGHRDGVGRGERGARGRQGAAARGARGDCGQCCPLPCCHHRPSRCPRCAGRSPGPPAGGGGAGCGNFQQQRVAPGAPCLRPGRGAVPVPPYWCRCQRQHRPPVSWDSRAGGEYRGRDGTPGDRGGLQRPHSAPVPHPERIGRWKCPGVPGDGEGPL